VVDTQKLEVVWNGTSGLPGVSVFYGPPAVDPTGDVKEFFNAIKAIFPTGLTWTIPNGGDTVDEGSGVLTGGWTGANGGAVSASGGLNHAAGCGGYVQWLTTTVTNGWRVKGRTFLAPLMNSAYDSSGTIENTYLATIQTAANALVAAGTVWVWHRPTAGTGGNGCVMTAANVPDQVTSLKTRRR
jgi:hypothetical protein